MLGFEYTFPQRLHWVLPSLLSWKPPDFEINVVVALIGFVSIFARWESQFNLVRVKLNYAKPWRLKIDNVYAE